MNVSAVVPVYNAATTLERAINSLLIQPEINEIFIVDDGSTDGSYGLVLDIERRYDLIKVLTHPNHANRGASASRNLGLKFCTNEWIQFLDADDELLENKVKNQIELVQNDCSIIVSNSIWINSRRTKIVKFSEKLWVDLILSKLGNTCSNLWNKSCIHFVGGWDEELVNTQEYDLMFRILRNKENVIYDKSCLTIVYETEGSITRSTDFFYVKFLNQVQLRKSINNFLKLSGKNSLITKLCVHGYIGTLMRNYKIVDFKDYNLFYYLIFKSMKSITDRLIK